MQIEVKEDRGVKILTMKGDTLDASNAQQFRTATAQIESGRYVFDMSNLKFVDSSGIGALLSCLRRVNASDGEIKLAGLQPNVSSLFALVRMDRLFDIRADVGDAVSAFGT